MEKLIKLKEKATGLISIVTSAKLAEMKRAPAFQRVFAIQEGEPTEEEVLTFNKSSKDAKVPAPQPQKPTPAIGKALPVSQMPQEKKEADAKKAE